MQLSFPDYILESRQPTLPEICALLGEVEVKLPPKAVNSFKSKRRYPSNWSEVAHYYKSIADYCCAICGKQCLRPDDSRDSLSASEISRRTLNLHHISGDIYDDRPENLLPVCSAHHLQIHRGRKTPPLGQQQLFTHDSSVHIWQKVKLN